MFLVVARNKDVFSVYDTDDGVVDKFKVSELLDIARSTGITILGLVPECSSISCNLGFFMEDQVLKFGYSDFNIFPPERLLKPKTIKIWGSCSLKVDASLFSSTNWTDMFRQFGNYSDFSDSDLTKLLACYYLCQRCGISVAPTYALNMLIKILHNYYKGRSNFSVECKLKTSSGELIGRYTNTGVVLSFVEYKNSVFFYDTRLVLEIPKSAFEKLNNIAKLSSKLTLSDARNTSFDVRGNVILNQFAEVTITGKECVTFIVPSSVTQLCRLDIKKDAINIKFRNHNNSLVINKLSCRSPEAMSNIIRHSYCCVDLKVTLSCLPVLIDGVDKFRFESLEIIDKGITYDDIKPYITKLSSICADDYFCSRYYRNRHSFILALNRYLQSMGYPVMPEPYDSVEFTLEYMCNYLDYDITTLLAYKCNINLGEDYIQKVTRQYFARLISGSLGCSRRHYRNDDASLFWLYDKATLLQVIDANAERIKKHLNVIQRIMTLSQKGIIGGFTLTPVGNILIDIEQDTTLEGLIKEKFGIDDFKVYAFHIEDYVIANFCLDYYEGKLCM